MDKLTPEQWNSAVVVALLILAFVLLAIFIAVQILLPDTATVPPRILSQRTMISAFLVVFCIGAHMMIFGKSGSPLLPAYPVKHCKKAPY